MKIALDAMGGDHAPQAVLEATRLAAVAQPRRELLLVGLPEVLSAAGPLPDNIRLVPCGSIMAMDEDVRNLMRKKDSSIWLATELVKKGEADAVVSAGSTAAQMAAATLLLGRVPGVSRPAIGMILPTLEGGRLLLDMGANADCTPEMLLEFAEMGDVYVRLLLGIEQPRIALLSNGTEEHKGNKLTQAAYALIKNSKLNFIGNLEGRDILAGGYDVIVCDGMSGNIAIKSMEGAAKMIMTLLKRELTRSKRNKLGAALVKGGLTEVKRAMDYQEYGGAPLLGVNGVSIVCHGSSEAAAIVNAIDAAEKCATSGFVAALAQALAAPEQ